MGWGWVEWDWHPWTEFDILEPQAFKNIANVGSFKHFFVQLSFYMCFATRPIPMLTSCPVSYQLCTFRTNCLTTRRQRDNKATVEWIQGDCCDTASLKRALSPKQSQWLVDQFFSACLLMYFPSTTACSNAVVWRLFKLAHHLCLPSFKQTKTHNFVNSAFEIDTNLKYPE